MLSLMLTKVLKKIYVYPNLYHRASKHLSQITAAVNNKM